MAGLRLQTGRTWGYDLASGPCDPKDLTRRYVHGEWSNDDDWYDTNFTRENSEEYGYDD